MDYKNKYNDALKKLQEALAPKDGCEISGLTRGCIEEIFPELKESEDEKIRKRIIHALHGDVYLDMEETTKAIAWLEKQESVEEIVERCKDSWYNEGKIAGMAEGLSDDEKYQQGWHDAIEKKEEKVDNANKSVLDFKASDYYVSKVDGKIHNVHNFNELKKIEQSSAWSEEDEKMMLSIEQVMNCASLLNIVPQKIDKVRTWLKSIKERIG